jgi:hypothetical protein
LFAHQTYRETGHISLRKAGIMDNALGEEIEEEEVEEPTQDEAEEETQEDETQEDDQDTDDEPEEKPPWFKKRFDRLTYQREQARREAAEAKEERERLKAEVEKLKATKNVAEGKPKLEDFDSDEDFFDALTDWKLEQREQKTKAAREEERQTQTKQEAEKTFKETVVSVNTAGEAKYEDYMEAVTSLPGDVMDSELAQAIFETDAPEDIAYHLGKNPKEAAKISKLSPLKKAIALGKIEARLSNKKTTSAPPPIKPVKGKGGTDFDPDKLLDENPAEWIRLRNEGKI